MNKKVCKECESDDIIFTSLLKYNRHTKEYEPISKLERGYCNDCGEEFKSVRTFAKGYCFCEKCSNIPVLHLLERK